MIRILLFFVFFCTWRGHGAMFDDQIPSFEIAPNVMMPGINCGHPDDNSTETNAALDWLKAGGRGIDTAYDYHNQDQVGAAIRESGIDRENIFITTKISPGICTAETALAAVKRDLKELQLEYVDLVLHHFPCALGGEKGNVEIWKGLEMALEQNLTRSIGVSNYVQKDLEPILNLNSVVPALNQAQMSVGSHDDDWTPGHVKITFCDFAKRGKEGLTRVEMKPIIDAWR